MARTWPAVAAAALALIAPASAAASETFGSALGAPADGFFTCEDPSGCILAQTALPGRAVTASRDGVVVRWRASFFEGVPAQEVALVLLRRDGTKYTVAGVSSPVEVGDGEGSLSASTALRVRAGDQLAILLEDAGEIGTFTRPSEDASVAAFAPALTGTESREPDDSGPTDAEILLNADVEPDLDGDGRGDETQDNCPESPRRTAVPCTIDLAVTTPVAPPHLTVGSSAAVTVPMRWRLAPDLLQWVLPGGTVTIDAPSHAPFIPSPVSPCTILTPRRAVCPFEFRRIGGLFFVLSEVDERTAPRQLVGSGATFTASVSSSVRDADPSNNSITWTVPIDEPHCGQRLIGTRRANRIVGTGYSDIIEGRNGHDTLIGRHGRDCIEGGWGNDRLVTNDGERDAVLCGPGRRDLAVVDRRDRPRGCETVRRRPARR